MAYASFCPYSRLGVGSALGDGSVIVKQVPVCPAVEVSTRIPPPSRPTIPFTTHNPIPVPFSPLVLKKGL